jgi:hypothetical protein
MSKTNVKFELFETMGTNGLCEFDTWFVLAFWAMANACIAETAVASFASHEPYLPGNDYLLRNYRYLLTKV